MEEFKGVSVVRKANIYFDGRVTSRTVLFADGSKKTLGIMLPGEYEFNTGEQGAHGDHVRGTGRAASGRGGREDDKGRRCLRSPCKLEIQAEGQNTHRLLLLVPEVAACFPPLFWGTLEEKDVERRKG